MFKFKGLRIYSDVEITAHSGKLADYLKLPYATRNLYISGHTTRGELFPLYLTNFDYAVPETWADDYAKRNGGNRPDAVWSYDNDAWGAPVFLSHILDLLCTDLQAAIERGEIRFEQLD